MPFKSDPFKGHIFIFLFILSLTHIGSFRAEILFLPLPISFPLFSTLRVFYLEDDCSRFPPDVSNVSPDYMASHLKRH
jgi:hypothetical protein